MVFEKVKVFPDYMNQIICYGDYISEITPFLKSIKNLSKELDSWKDDFLMNYPDLKERVHFMNQKVHHYDSYSQGTYYYGLCIDHSVVVIEIDEDSISFLIDARSLKKNKVKKIVYQLVCFFTDFSAKELHSKIFFKNKFLLKILNYKRPV